MHRQFEYTVTVKDCGMAGFAASIYRPGFPAPVAFHLAPIASDAAAAALRKALNREGLS